MADENNDPNGGGSGPTPGDMQMPVIQIVSQYVKDLSFENPSMGMNIRQPQIEFSVDLQARRVAETGPFEVLLKLRVSATQEEKTAAETRARPASAVRTSATPTPTAA